MYQCEHSRFLLHYCLFLCRYNDDPSLILWTVMAVVVVVVVASCAVCLSVEPPSEGSCEGGSVAECQHLRWRDIYTVFQGRVGVVEGG